MASTGTELTFEALVALFRRLAEEKPSGRLLVRSQDQHKLIEWKTGRILS